MIVFKILGLVFWLLVIPYAMGLVPIHFSKTSKESKGTILILGYLLMLTVLEVVGIPIVMLFTYDGYVAFMIAFGLACAALAGLGIYLERHSLSEYMPYNLYDNFMIRLRKSGMEAKIYGVLIFIAIAVQFVMVFVLASMDADDFYYNSQALTAQTFKTLYRIDANTGRSTYLDLRHAMALFPIWQAFVSSMSGVHVAVLAHKIIPLILIPLSYLLTFKIGELLLPKKRETALAFTFLMNVWRMFGYVSLFNAETFFLLRTWQGKSFAGNFIMPAIVWIFLYMYKAKDNPRFVYIVLTMLVTASGAASSLAVLMTCGLIILLSLMFMIAKKNPRIFIKQTATCIPGAIYMLVYLLAK